MKAVKNIISIFTWTMMTVMVSGCARKTPTETIIDNHIDHIGEVLDYAYNNMEQTKDVVALEHELKNCQISLDDVKQTHKSEIATCEAKTNYWRLATFGLLIAICVGILAKLKRWFI